MAAKLINYHALLHANKPLRWLFLATFASSIGDWCRHVAIVGLAISCTGSGLKIAVLLLLELFPLLFFGPMAGVIIDRVSPRRVMVFCDVARASFSLGFLFVQSGEHLWAAYVLTALISVFDAPSQAARQTLISKLTSHHNLVTVQSLFSLGDGLCIAVGSSAATWLIAAWGRQQLFIFDAATFMVSCFLLLTIKDRAGRIHSSGHADNSTGYFEDLKEGITYVRSSSQAGTLLLFNAIRSAGSGIIYFLLGVFGYTVFDAGVEGVGLFHVTFGAGFFVGAILAKELAKRLGWMHYALVMGFAALTEGLFVSLFSHMDELLPALVILSFAYMGRSLIITLFNSLNCRLIDERFRGRYFSLNRVFSYTAMGTSMLLSGWGLSLFSARCIALFAGVFLFVNGALLIMGSNKIAKLFVEMPEFSE